MNEISQSGRVMGLVLSVLTMLLGVSGCYAPSANRPAPCRISSLVLRESDLPPADWWQAGQPDQDQAPARAGIEKIGTGFSTPSQGVLTHQIYRFRDGDEATKGYERTTRGWFSVRANEPPWVTPVDLSELSVGADQFRLACSNRLRAGAEECWYFARYGPYVSELNVTMLAVSHADLGKLVGDIDDRMKTCLKGP